MERDIFVQNVKSLCFARTELPTIACKKAGVGGSFISDINRGRTPSIEKVQRLADYFGVTTSQLLGEEPLPDGILNPEESKKAKPLPLAPILKPNMETPADQPASPKPDIFQKFEMLSPEDQEEIQLLIEMKLTRQKRSNQKRLD